MELRFFSYSLSSVIAVNKRQVSLQSRTYSKKGLSRLPSFRRVASKCNEFQEGHRRSANYHPSIWDPKLIESFRLPYTYETHSKQLEELKGEAKGLLTSSTDPAVLLKHIDAMKSLGVAYHFEREINEVLCLVSSYVSSDLHTATMQFRLLRDNGFSVSSGAEMADFFDGLSQDIEGLLSLYEASHLATPEEEILEEAKNFSAKHLKSLTGKQESDLVKRVLLSLEIPLHWRVPRLEARNFIDSYQKNDSKNLTLLELTKLDYNLQPGAIHKQEVRQLSEWWGKLDFSGWLSFSRDRLMENYLWTLGWGQYLSPTTPNAGKSLPNLVCILTAIDDIYDVYGQSHELESFTAAMNRWDIKAVEELPDYMKICYVALLNLVDEFSYDVLKDEGLNIRHNIEEEWARLCRSYMVETRWFQRNYVPTMKEYVENAWISVGGPAMIVHAYPLLGCKISEDALNAFTNSKLICWSSLITRLWDDLGTSEDESKRGDVAKSIMLYGRRRSNQRTSRRSRLGTDTLLIKEIE